MKSDLAPVALFCFNRADHLAQTIEALKSNQLASATDLYVFSDGPRSVSDKSAVGEVRSLLNYLTGFKSVTLRLSEVNKGLAASIISGVTEVLSIHKKIIVIEDDLVLSSFALSYFNAGLDFYSNNERVFSISGYNYPDFPIPAGYEYDVFCIPRMQCWGWATWEEKWDLADFDMKDYGSFIENSELVRNYERLIGKNSLGTLKSCVEQSKDVWACRWVYTHFKYDAVCVCPVESLVRNIGLDGSGQNCGVIKGSQSSELSTKSCFVFNPEITVDSDIFAQFMVRAVPGSSIAEHSMMMFDPKQDKRNNLSVGARISKVVTWVSEWGIEVRSKLSIKVGVVKTLFRNWLNPVFEPKIDRPRGKLVRLGTSYGGWYFVETDTLKGGTILSLGAGEDISFDVEFADLYGATVIIVDPTPRAISHVKAVMARCGYAPEQSYSNDGNQPVGAYNMTNVANHQLELVPKAIWSERTNIKFFKPQNDKSVSHSIVNFKNDYNMEADSPHIIVEAVVVEDIISEFNLSNLPLVKMDIEGAELAVLPDLFKKSVFPEQILVEFDGLMTQSRKSVNLYKQLDELLRDNSYECIKFDRPSNLLYRRVF